MYFGYEGKGRIGSPVFYLPKDHPIISEYENLIQQDTLLPNWLGFVRGKVRPFWWNLIGQEFSPPDLGITIYGNDGFTRLAKRHNCFKEAQKKESFYAWIGDETNKLFTKNDFSHLLKNSNCLGIHIHRKHWAVSYTHLTLPTNREV